ncbi:MAG: GH39 family glycosyl hydrolase [Christensenellaceae bacterium]
MREYCEKRRSPRFHFHASLPHGRGARLRRGKQPQLFQRIFRAGQTDKAAVNALANEFVTFAKTSERRQQRRFDGNGQARQKGSGKSSPLHRMEQPCRTALRRQLRRPIAKTIPDNMGLADAYSYWTFSDILEEDGFPSAAFHGGYGLLTLQNVAKAPYRAFQLLHRLGEERYQKKFAWETLDIYAFRDRSNNTVQLLCVNHQSLLHDVSVRTADRAV